MKIPHDQGQRPLTADADIEATVVGTTVADRGRDAYVMLKGITVGVQVGVGVGVALGVTQTLLLVVVGSNPMSPKARLYADVSQK